MTLMPRSQLRFVGRYLDDWGYRKNNPPAHTSFLAFCVFVIAIAPHWQSDGGCYDEIHYPSNEQNLIPIRRK